MRMPIILRAYGSPPGDGVAGSGSMLKRAAASDGFPRRKAGVRYRTYPHDASHRQGENSLESPFRFCQQWAKRFAHELSGAKSRYTNQKKNR